MAQKNEAIDVAQRLTDEKGEISHFESKRDRHTFHYDDVVHAHKLPEDWEFAGFGKGWFAIRLA